jgi:hypothetical protein
MLYRDLSFMGIVVEVVQELFSFFREPRIAPSARRFVLYDHRSLKDFCINQLWEEF